MAEACFGTDAAVIGRDLPGFLERNGVHGDDLLALVEGPRRFPLYRKLLRGNVTGVTTAILSRTHAHLEARVPGVWDEAFDRYLAGEGPRTPHLRDVPIELGAVLAPMLATSTSVPGYLGDLLRLELEEFRIGAHPDVPIPTEVFDVDAQKPLALRLPVSRFRAAHAVHELGEEVGEAPVAAETRYGLYRDAAHETCVVVLTSFADELLAAILEGVPLGASIARAASTLGVPLTEALLTEVAKWLADFGARGVVLGSREG
jgi:hypothetical protein